MGKPKINDKRWYPAREAALLLDVTAETIRDQCRRGVLTAEQKGGRRTWHVLGAVIRKRRTVLKLD